MMRLFLGVDGGNTKTVALLATADGRVVGAGRSGCSDIFNATTEADALAELDGAVAAALSAAGVSAGAIESAMFCLAGADWPEDVAFLRDAVGARGYGRCIAVGNDALGGLRAGTTDGVGVILACGTGGAVAARSALGGFWHSGFWAEPLGGGAIGRMAVQAAVRSGLGIPPPTRLAELLVAHFGTADIEALVKRHNGRGTRPLTDIALSRIAPLVLDAADAGDDVALGIVAAQATLLADYGRVAARRVGLDFATAPVVLAGGVFRHDSGLMAAMIRQRLEGACRSITMAEREPATGALMLALEAGGIPMTPERLDTIERSAPRPQFYRTAG